MNLKEYIWPMIQSLDFIKGNYKKLAEIIYSEISRYTETEPGIIQKNIYINEMKDFANIFDEYTNVPTQFLIMQINNEWTMLLTNSFLCSGYDSLSYNLTRVFRCETLHINSHDQTTTFLPGSEFTHRIFDKDKIIERRVQASVDDLNKWVFYESGIPLHWENTEYYKKKKIKDRLNESIISEYLSKLNLIIYKDTELFIGVDAILIKRTKKIETILEKKFNHIQKNFT